MNTDTTRSAKLRAAETRISRVLNEDVSEQAIAAKILREALMDERVSPDRVLEPPRFAEKESGQLICLAHEIAKAELAAERVTALASDLAALEPHVSSRSRGHTGAALAWLISLCLSALIIAATIAIVRALLG